MKYILFEAIVLKKVLSRDEATCCMKPDIQITVCPDAVKTNTRKDKNNDYSFLIEVFHSQLLEYLEKHPEVRPASLFVHVLRLNPFAKLCDGG